MALTSDGAFKPKIRSAPRERTAAILLSKQTSLLDALERLKNPNLLLLRIVARYRFNYRRISRKTRNERVTSGTRGVFFLTK